jgi:hypothetical protein
MTEEVQTPQVEALPPSLSISDLIVLTNLTSAAAQRGAIRADEMQLVGAVYDKLIAFLTAAGALKPAEQAAEAPQTEEV